MARLKPRPIAIRLVAAPLAAWLAAHAVFFGPVVSAAEPATAGPAAAELEFFEKQIRPLLAQHCYECHGAKKSQANLRLDLSAGWLRGGDSGPAVVPKAPDESLLVQAIEYDGDSVEMPPTGKLPDETIALLTSWVARGAIAPPDRRLRPRGARRADDVTPVTAPESRSDPAVACHTSGRVVLHQRQPGRLGDDHAIATGALRLVERGVAISELSNS